MKPRGAVAAAAWVHDYAPKIRCLILATPAFKVKLYVPLAVTGLKLASKFNDNSRYGSMVHHMPCGVVRAIAHPAVVPQFNLTLMNRVHQRPNLSKVALMRPHFEIGGVRSVGDGWRNGGSSSANGIATASRPR